MNGGKFLTRLPWRVTTDRRSTWLNDLWRRSVAARQQRLRVRIPLEAWLPCAVCCKGTSDMRTRGYKVTRWIKRTETKEEETARTNQIAVQTRTALRQRRNIKKKTCNVNFLSLGSCLFSDSDSFCCPRLEFKLFSENIFSDHQHNYLLVAVNTNYTATCFDHCFVIFRTCVT